MTSVPDKRTTPPADPPATPRTGPAPGAAAKRWEPAVLGALALALLVVPPVVSELYPFSFPTMFSAAPRQLAYYTVTDADGRQIDLERVSLHIREWHDPPVRTLGRNGYGRPRPESAHLIGEVAPPEAVEAAVRRAWLNDPGLPSPLHVRQQVFAQGHDGALACIADRAWTWTRERDPDADR